MLDKKNFYINGAWVKPNSSEEFTNKRIEEQLYTGYIEKTDNGYRVSQSIKNFISLKNLISTIFNTGN